MSEPENIVVGRDNWMDVGVFVVVRDASSRFLLVKHNYGQKKWSLPGGKLEQAELVPVGAKREVQEETGLEVEIGELVGMFPLRLKRGLVILFEAIKTGGILYPENGEISECRYWRINEIDSSEIYPAQLALLYRAECFRNNGRNLIHDWLIPYPSYSRGGD